MTDLRTAPLRKIVSTHPERYGRTVEILECGHQLSLAANERNLGCKSRHCERCQARMNRAAKSKKPSPMKFDARIPNIERWSKDCACDSTSSTGTVRVASSDMRSNGLFEVSFQLIGGLSCNACGKPWKLEAKKDGKA